MKANFNGNPTPQDVDFVAQKLGIQGQSQPQSQQPQSFLDQLTNNPISKGIQTLFPGQQVGNAIGTEIAKLTSPESGQSGIAPGPTPLQVAGDVGQGALMLGSLGAAAPETALGRIGLQAGIGAGFGATGALAQGKTGIGDIATQTAVGGALGGGLQAVGEGVSNALSNLAERGPESQLENQANRLKTLSNSLEENTTYMKDPATGQIVEKTNPIKTMVQEGLIPTVDDGKVNAQAVKEGLDQLIQGQEDQAASIVKTLDGTVPAEDIENDLKNAVKSSSTIRGQLKLPQALSEVDSRMSSLRMSYGEDIPYQALDEIRRGMNREFDPEKRDVARIIGDSMRGYLYGESGSPELQQVLAREGDLIKARDFAEKLHGTAVKGGRLGKYFAQLIGGMAGGSVGGPVGVLAGGWAGDKALSLAQRNTFEPIGSRTAGALSNAINSPVGQATSRAAKVELLRQLLNR